MQDGRARHVIFGGHEREEARQQFGSVPLDAPHALNAPPQLHRRAMDIRIFHFPQILLHQLLMFTTDLQISVCNLQLATAHCYWCLPIDEVWRS